MALISYFGFKFNFVSVKCNTNWQPFNLDVAGKSATALTFCSSSLTKIGYAY